jgi:drug/metabolite transporter (DMT)-like permease
MSEGKSGGERAAVVGALVAVQVFFGLHYLAAKVVVEFVSPRAWALMRVSLAFLVLLGVCVVMRRSLAFARKDLARLAGLSIFGVVINQVCFIEGLSRTTPGHSSIIMTSIPVGTLLFAILLGRERLDRWKVISLAVSFVGVVLVIRSGTEETGVGELLRGETRLGDLLTLVNALSYSFFLVISKRLLMRIDPLAATTVLLGFGSIGIAIVGGPELAATDLGTVPARVWWLAAYIVVFPTALAYLFNYWALARVSSYLVALFIYLQPLIATTMSAVIFGERFGPEVAAGGLLVCLGVYLALPRPASRPSPEEDVPG